jgi:hypothetical protein
MAGLDWTREYNGWHRMSSRDTNIDNCTPSVLLKTVKTGKTNRFQYKIQNLKFGEKNKKPSDIFGLSFSFWFIDQIFYLKFKI